MANFNEKEKIYAEFWRGLSNFLKNSSGYPVGGVARAGSRRKGTHTSKSDLDVIFWISKNPSKTEVYPNIVERIIPTFGVNADIGSSYNVIKLWKTNVSCDLVLRTENQFISQVDEYQYISI